MKKLLALLILSAFTATAAADRVFLTITVETNPLTSDNIVFTAPAARTIEWSNTTTLTRIATTGTVNAAATNLYLYFGAYSIGAPRLAVAMASANSVRLYGESGQSVVASVNSSWASLTYSTQTVSRMYPVAVPISGEPYATNRTNIASGLVQGINDYNTNTLSTNTPALRNYATKTNAQLVTPYIAGGTVSNVTAHATGGTFANGIFNSPTTTNLVNYGNAISSPGSGTDSEQFGTGASATGLRSLASGKTALASGQDSVAYGYGATASGQSSVALGQGAGATTTNTVAIGAGAEATHYGSTALGTGASTTKANQLVLGSSTTFVEAPGLFTTGTSSNITHTGTNYMYGIYRTSVQIISSLSAGINVLGAISSPLVELNTTGSAFTIAGIPAGVSGQRLVIINLTGQNMTIAHESGADPTPAQRILTLTGADRATTGNGAAMFYYSTAQSRWILYHLDQ